MVAMQVADENMIDTATTDFVFHNLHLSAFAAIYKQYLIVKGECLWSGMPVEGWYGGVVSEYR